VHLTTQPQVVTWLRIRGAVPPFTRGAECMDRVVCICIVAHYCRNGEQSEKLIKDGRATFRNVGCSVYKREWLNSD